MAGLLVILLLVLLFVGAGRLGDVGKGLGEGVRAFRRSLGSAPKKKRKKKRTSGRSTSELDQADVVWERRRVKAPKRRDDES